MYKPVNSTLVWLPSTLIEDLFENMGEKDTFDDLLKSLLPEGCEIIEAETFDNSKISTEHRTLANVDFVIVDCDILYTILKHMENGDNLENLLAKYLGFKNMFDYSVKRGLV